MSTLWPAAPVVAQMCGIAATVWTAACVLVFTAGAWRLQRFRRAQGSAKVAGRGWRILVLRPCAGAEPGLLEHLCSAEVLAGFASQLVVLHLAEPQDAAWPLAQRAATQLSAAGLVAHAVPTKPAGANHKASQLAAADTWLANCDVCVCIDSDVHLDAACLPALCSALQIDAACGAAWLPFVNTEAPRTLGDRASQAILHGSLHAFALLGHLDAHVMVGKVLALRAVALQQIGGWQSVQHVLSEDMAMARRLRQHGWKVRMAAGVAATPQGGRSLSSVLARHSRWMVKLRRQRPRQMCTYPLLFFVLPQLAGLWLVVACGQRPRIGLYGLAAACACRWGTAMLARHACGLVVRPIRALGDVALSELMLAAAFVQALCTRRVIWRQRSFLVGPGGEIKEWRALPAERPAVAVAWPPRRR